jgi:hypothetical protein
MPRYQHFIDNIDRLYRCEHMGEKVIIRGSVFAFDEQRRAKQSQSRGELGGATLHLYTFHETSRIFGLAGIATTGAFFAQ